MTARFRRLRRCLLSFPLLASALLVITAVPSQSSQEVLSVVESATIVNEALESRILVRFGSLDHLSNEWIASAALHLPLAGALPAVRVQADLVKTSWTSGATWETPWTEAGGDPHGDQPVVQLVRSGPETGFASIDVTYLVRSLQAGEVSDHGFLLWPFAPDREGFTPAEMAALGAPSAAVLEVSYRKLSVHGITP